MVESPCEKADLCETPADLRRQVERLHAGLLVETLDARRPEQVAVLETWCRAGQSVALLAERRARQRSTGRMYKTVIADKRRRRDGP